jgi:hypothetical protein
LCYKKIALEKLFSFDKLELENEKQLKATKKDSIYFEA